MTGSPFQRAHLLGLYTGSIMSAGQIAVLIAATACVLVFVGLLVVVSMLRHQVRRLDAIADELRQRTMPLVVEAHRVVDQAATEMERVGAVLDSTESVHSTVDAASKLAYRAFANPVVKVLAVRAGASGGLRRLLSATPAGRGIGTGTSIVGSSDTTGPPTDRERVR